MDTPVLPVRSHVMHLDVPINETMAPSTGPEADLTRNSVDHGRHIQRQRGKLLQFILRKLQEILNTGSALLITRHHVSLNKIVQCIEQLKLQVVEEKFNNGKSDEEISTWTAFIEGHNSEGDTIITKLTK